MARQEDIIKVNRQPVIDVAPLGRSTEGPFQNVICDPFRKSGHLSLNPSPSELGVSAARIATCQNSRCRLSQKKVRNVTASDLEIANVALKSPQCNNVWKQGGTIREIFDTSVGLRSALS